MVDMVDTWLFGDIQYVVVQRTDIGEPFKRALQELEFEGFHCKMKIQ